MNVCFCICMNPEDSSFEYSKRLMDEMINQLTTQNIRTSYVFSNSINWFNLRDSDYFVLFASNDNKDEISEIQELADNISSPIIFVTDPQSASAPYGMNCIQYRLSHHYPTDLEKLMEILKSCNDEYLKEQDKRTFIVKTNVAEYLKKTFRRLKRYDFENRLVGYILFSCSIFALIVGLYFTVNFDLILDIDIKELNQSVLIHTIFSSVINALKIALFSAISRLCYILGKSFMAESTKIRNTIHAISFGDFYLNAYGTEVTRYEVKDILSEWNTNSTNPPINVANHEPCDEYDPIILKLLDEINNLIKNVNTISKPKD